jgi:hypothetical protein
VINASNNWAQLYAESVVDVSDVAEEIGNALVFLSQVPSLVPCVC